MRSKSLLLLAGLALAACSDQPASRDAPSAAAPPVTVEAKDKAPGAPAATAPAAPAEKAAPTQPQVTRTRDQTLCGEFEDIVYSCQINGRTLSVCASNIDPADISYTYGRSVSQVELSMRAEGDNGRVHQGGVSGGGGGHGSHIRFTNGDTQYIVYSGYPGRYAETDRRWSGVAIQRNGRDVANMACPYDGPYTQVSESKIPDFVPQESDDRYNAWY